ncbi:uncharacterized protein C2845_PM15G08960 [Panicum miliaceum]|uniref:T-complex protein 11-like protein 1 n=1 Tax=Panicum miliaceum TaxID=4540 RepID=A0A3L6Q3G5_PANMI|nr:uncharacterized protein C2845_PM15G08960 [Panicum miliaceum]
MMVGEREPVAMEIPAEEGAAARGPPRRIRKRLVEGARGGGAPASVEEIEARLREAELRRQQFHEWLACKARKKPRSPSWSSQEEDHGQRLEAKLLAAEQKRLSLLAKAQNRLAKLDELRQAAKNHVEMRFEKEREELETRVESRVRQAEENRLRLLQADMQKRAALKERTARSLVQKATSESKYMEQVRSAILQKRTAAEKKRLRLLEAEKMKARARLLRIQKAAMNVCSQRETERKKLKEQLDNKLQRIILLGQAKRQRAEYLKQRGSPRNSAHADYVKHAEFLSRKLARCWRIFVKSRKTTLTLAEAYDALGINEKSVKRRSSDVTGHRKFRAQLANFDKAWCTYLYRFVVWKVKDARLLEEDLVRAACKLELSMMQTCKLTAGGQSTNNLTHDMKAIQKQVTDDQKLLREKVQHLSGDAGIERMDSALSDTRSKFFEAKENGGPLAAPVANVCTPLSINSSGKAPLEVNENSRTNALGSSSVVRSLFGASSSSSISPPVKQPTENEQMVNEMLHEDDSAFAARSDSANTAEKEFQKKVRETMEKAFWDMVTDSIRGDKPDYSRLINLVKEVRDSLHELAPKEWKEKILENIDLEILSQVLGSGSQDAQYLGQILRYSLDMVRKLSAAAKEDELKKSHDKLLSELAASSEVNDSGINSFVVAVIKGLRFILEEIKELQAEVAKARIQLMQPIIKGSAGVEYLQKAFTDRYGPPDNASASLPQTLQWISTSKGIVEEEWSDHSDCLSIMPPAGQAPALVPVLRAGHGAPVGQPSSSAAGASGQPECNGEQLDKLIRIGLLQLITSMEGLQMQSTPESLQINLLRLRAVQSQFQQVIAIATSMLVLRQVLMNENSKATHLELENAISELSKALVKILDSSPDAGTEEIVEAMISASALVGSPSEEKIQARRQMITRVFLKSLQPGDVVFKKVSRAVYCAFRGVVLGGSGHRGQKLADAALRRIGAVKLLDRVMKAAEVLIKVATVSEKVHGPWYKALM